MMDAKKKEYLEVSFDRGDVLLMKTFIKTSDLEHVRGKGDKIRLHFGMMLGDNKLCSYPSPIIALAELLHVVDGEEKREGGVRKGKVGGGGAAFHASQYTWHLLFSSRRRPQARC